MSLPRYAEYRDSGVPWLGEVPTHWNLRRVGYFFSERREKVSDKEFQPLSVTKHGVVPQLETAAKTDDGDNRKLVRAGDFVINSRSDRKGSSGASTLEGSVSLINTVLAPTNEISVHFAHHLLRSVPFQEEYYRFGKGIVADLWSTNYSEMRNIALAVPNYEEQREIAKFLDRETAKIDALIAEQETLLALLDEKRQATISHAVTCGLDPNVPMKDSGVPWLGDVPAHWWVGPLRRIVKRVDTGGTPSNDPPSENIECGVPWITPGDFTGDLDLKSASKAVSVQQVQKGEAKCFPADAIFIVGIGATLGKVGLFGSPASANQQINAITMQGAHVPRFFAYSLSAKVEVMRYLSNASTIGIMNQSKTKDIYVAVPPRTEQIEIASYLDGAMSKFWILEIQVRDAITLLEERRMALISAAVTGQIDVRGEVVPEAA